LKEGFELKPKAKITIGHESYYYIELTKNSNIRCKKACMGYVKAENLRELKKSLQKRLWTKRKTSLRLSPTGTKITEIPKNTKVIPESLTNQYYKVKVEPPGIKGWIERKDLTSIKPKGEKGKLTYVQESMHKPKEKVKKQPTYDIEKILEVEKKKPIHKKVKKKKEYKSQASKIASYYEKVRRKEIKKSKSKNVKIKGIVIAAKLNLRVKPNPNSTILAVIPRGYVVTVLGERKGKWIKVSYYSRSKKRVVVGWVLRKYIEY